jgi:hypothetical protein
MTITASVLILLIVFANGYFHAMGVYRAHLKGRLNGLPLLLCAPVLLITFALDVLLQFTVAALVFWRWPEEVGIERRDVVNWGRVWSVPWPVGDWFVTHRLRRYIAAGPALGWRYRFAHSICFYLADPFDPTGAHCDSDPPELKDCKK